MFVYTFHCLLHCLGISLILSSNPLFWFVIVYPAFLQLIFNWYQSERSYLLQLKVASKHLISIINASWDISKSKLYLAVFSSIFFRSWLWGTHQLCNKSWAWGLCSLILHSVDFLDNAHGPNDRGQKRRIYHYYRFTDDPLWSICAQLCILLCNAQTDFTGRFSNLFNSYIELCVMHSVG